MIEFVLVVMITLGTNGDNPKTITMNIPQDNQIKCEDASRNFTFALPVFSIETHCKPLRTHQNPITRKVKV
jgi:hypothetical protein